MIPLLLAVCAVVSLVIGVYAVFASMSITQRMADQVNSKSRGGKGVPTFRTSWQEGEAIERYRGICPESDLFRKMRRMDTLAIGSLVLWAVLMLTAIRVWSRS
jgi:hypothetical protein